MALTAKVVRPGRTIDHTPSGAAISAGDVVVIGTLVGVAPVDIADGEQGALYITGEFTVPKATGGGEAIAAGATVYWDAGNAVATTTASTHQVLGKTVAAAGDAAAEVTVVKSV